MSPYTDEFPESVFLNPEEAARLSAWLRIIEMPRGFNRGRWLFLQSPTFKDANRYVSHRELALLNDAYPPTYATDIILGRVTIEEVVIE